MALISDNEYALTDRLEEATTALSILTRKYAYRMAEFLRLSADQANAVIGGDGLIRWRIPKRRTAQRTTVSTRFSGSDAALTRTAFEERDQSFAPSTRISDGVKETWVRNIFFSDRLPSVLDGMAEAVGNELNEYGFDQIDTQGSAVWPPFGDPPISISAMSISDVWSMAELTKTRSFPQEITAATSPQIWTGPLLAKKLQSFPEFHAADKRGDGPSSVILNARFPYSYDVNWVWSDRNLSHTAGTATADPLVLTANVTPTTPTMELSGSADGRTLLAGDIFVFAGDETPRVVVNADEYEIGSDETYTAAGGGLFTGVRFDPPVDATISTGTALNLFGDMEYSVLHIPAAWVSAQFTYLPSETFSVATAVDTGLTPEQPGTGLRMNLVRGDKDDHSSFMDAVWLGGMRIARHDFVIKIRTEA